MYASPHVLMDICTCIYLQVGLKLNTALRLASDGPPGPGLSDWNQEDLFHKIEMHGAMPPDARK
jgi:hypothetical protein